MVASKVDVVVEALAAKEYGEMTGYTELGDLTGANRHVVQSLVRRASRRLLQEHQKTVICETNQGYRIAQPEEHLAVAMHHHKKGRRQVGYSLQTLRGTNRSKLTVEVLQRLDEMEETISAQQAMLRRMGRRQREMEGHLANVQGESQQNRQSLDDLSRRFHELEASLQKDGVIRQRDAA